MIRITLGNVRAGRLVLVVEGDLTGLAADELSRVSLARLADSSGLDLDLSGVTFVDKAGVRVVNHLIDLGVGIRRCSSFVAEVLGRGVGRFDPKLDSETM